MKITALFKRLFARASNLPAGAIGGSGWDARGPAVVIAILWLLLDGGQSLAAAGPEGTPLFAPIRITPPPPPRRACCERIRQWAAGLLVALTRTPWPVAQPILLAPVPLVPTARVRLQARPGFLAATDLIVSPHTGQRPGQHRPRLATGRRPSNTTFTVEQPLGPERLIPILQAVCQAPWALGMTEEYLALGTAQTLITYQQLIGHYFCLHEGVAARLAPLREPILRPAVFQAGPATLTAAEVEQVIDECKLFYAQGVAGTTHQATAALARRRPLVAEAVPEAALSGQAKWTAPVTAELEALPEQGSIKLRRAPAAGRTARRTHFMLPGDGRSGARLAVQAQRFAVTDPTLCCRSPHTGYSKPGLAASSPDTL